MQLDWNCRRDCALTAQLYTVAAKVIAAAAVPMPLKIDCQKGHSIKVTDYVPIVTLPCTFCVRWVWLVSVLHVRNHIPIKFLFQRAEVANFSPTK